MLNALLIKWSHMRKNASSSPHLGPLFITPPSINLPSLSLSLSLGEREREREREREAIGNYV
jgi:hypothetical protein